MTTPNEPTEDNVKPTDEQLYAEWQSSQPAARPEPFREVNRIEVSGTDLPLIRREAEPYIGIGNPATLADTKEALANLAPALPAGEVEDVFSISSRLKDLYLSGWYDRDLFDTPGTRYEQALQAIEALYNARFETALGSQLELPASTTGFQIVAYMGKAEWRSPIYGRELLPAQLHAADGGQDEFHN